MNEQTTAPAGLVALLSHVIDYAGLFPPAKLDMATTVANYAASLAGPDAWMIERLIIPVARLDEFETHAAAHLPRESRAADAGLGGETDVPWPISALPAVAGDPKLRDDMARIRAFNERHADVTQGLAVIDTIELKAGSVQAIDAALDLIEDGIHPFFELAVADDPRGLIAALVGGPEGAEAGAKVRTGGVTKDLYPAPAHVARFIAACALADVPFKATAGMHHPMRHWSDAVGTKELGFLNVFVAAVLARADRADEATILAVLEEESLDAFRFNDAGVGWRERFVETEAVDDARLTFAVSFGSCSFDEPREDLQRMKLI